MRSILLAISVVLAGCARQDVAPKSPEPRARYQALNADLTVGNAATVFHAVVMVDTVTGQSWMLGFVGAEAGVSQLKWNAIPPPPGASTPSTFDPFATGQATLDPGQKP